MHIRNFCFLVRIMFDVHNFLYRPCFLRYTHFSLHTWNKLCFYYMTAFVYKILQNGAHCNSVLFSKSFSLFFFPTYQIFIPTKYSSIRFSFLVLRRILNMFAYISLTEVCMVLKFFYRFKILNF